MGIKSGEFNGLANSMALQIHLQDVGISAAYSVDPKYLKLLS